MASVPNLTVITGLPRSGTSAVAGALFRLGVNLGSKFVAADKWNQLGYFECQEFSALHLAIFRLSAKLELAPPPDALLQRYKALILGRAKEAAGRPWGVKHPLACFFLELIGSAIAPYNLILCQRPFHEVVQSFAAVNSWDLHKTAQRLALHAYAVSKAAAYPGARLLQVDYPCLVREPGKEVERLARFLELEVNTSAVAQIDWRLKHY